MKQTPQELAVQAKMQPGMLTHQGFLGEDDRHYHEIIADDLETLEKLGISAEAVADKLETLAAQAFEADGYPVRVDEKFEVSYQSFRGKIACPFPHPGVYGKGEITIKNLGNQKELKFTPLNIHLIREHGFFEGKGSAHRLEPQMCWEVLWK